jgi:hypothetical protein
MTQEEFDNQVADILVLGTKKTNNDFYVHESWKNIGKLYVSLSDSDKKFAYKSKILAAFMKSNDKEIRNYILNNLQ